MPPFGSAGSIRNAEGARKVQILNALYRRSGVSKRHSVVLRAGDEDPFVRQTFYKTATDDSDLGPTTFERMQRFEASAPELAQSSCERALADAKVDAASDIRHLVHGFVQRICGTGL